MHVRFSKICGFGLYSGNDEIGVVAALLFDENDWSVHSLVARSVQRPSEQAIIIRISDVLDVDFDLETVSVASVASQTESSESTGHQQSFAHQVEQPTAETVERQHTPQDRIATLLGSHDPTTIADVRSVAETRNYQIFSNGAKAGTVKDFVIDSDSWAVKHGVAEASTWLPRESSMFETGHIVSVNKSKRAISVDLSEENLPLGLPTIQQSNGSQLQFDHAAASHAADQR